MVLTLYGLTQFTCTTASKLYSTKKKVSFEFVAIDMVKREHKSAAFVEKQPFGQMPYIDDDGFIVYKSRASVATLQTGKALFEQGASIEYSNFDPFASHAVAEMYLPGEASDKVVFNALIDGLFAKLDAYEVILRKQDVTLADLLRLPYATMLAVAVSDIMTYKGPDVIRWYKSAPGALRAPGTSPRRLCCGTTYLHVQLEYSSHIFE
ncbi:hypothetical protein C8R44DRAFT_882886 [Mycena epipterygia]|nr:hypothetical protein C8R44DRAFT_882886 [Mycena epipterygia]